MYVLIPVLYHTLDPLYSFAFIHTFLNITSVSGLSGPTTNNLSTFSNPIPWQKAGVWYNDNEIYFDIVEMLDAIINK